MNRNVLDLVDRAGWTFVQAAIGAPVGPAVTSDPVMAVLISAGTAGLVAVAKFFGVKASMAARAETVAHTVEALPQVQKLAATNDVVKTSEQVADEVAQGLMK